MNTELENTRDKWRQQCEEEVERRLNEREVEAEKKLKEKEAEVEKKLKEREVEVEERVKGLWAADLSKLRQNFQVRFVQI